MTDTNDTASTLTSAPKDSSAQMTVALATVAALVAISIGLIILAWVTKAVATIPDVAVGGVTTIIGILGNSLASPTGIGSVIAAARKAAP